MILIAAVDENWGIGNNGQLLTRISKDMQYFKEKTTGQIIILGRKTLETFPSAKPLLNRLNIILTKDTGFHCQGAAICHSTEEAIAFAAKHPDKELFIAGGGSIYQQYLPYCDTAYITKIHRAFPADTYIENLDNSPEWELSDESERFCENDLYFTFAKYKIKTMEVSPPNHQQG